LLGSETEDGEDEKVSSLLATRKGKSWRDKKRMQGKKRENVCEGEREERERERDREREREKKRDSMDAVPKKRETV